MEIRKHVEKVHAVAGSHEVVQRPFKRVVCTVRVIDGNDDLVPCVNGILY